MELPKASQQLKQRISEAGENDLIEVIVELQHLPTGQGEQKVPRAEKIASQKSAFTRGARPLAEWIARHGGQVVDEAWINQSLRIRIPVRALRELAAEAAVSLLDVSHQLKRP